MSAVRDVAAPGPRYYIGGGNVAGILGLSPYKSPLDEYLVMLAANEDVAPQKAAFFKRRKALEPFAAEVFQQVTGLRIVRRNESYVDREHDFIRAEIDFEVEDDGNGETKTVHPLAAKDWGPSDSDEIPVHVTAQTMHGLMVTGRSHSWVHALVGLDDDRIYRIERDEEVIAGIREHEIAFWHRHVLPRVQPAPSTIADLRRLFPRDIGREVLGDEYSADIDELRLLATAIKDAETKREEIELRLKLFMRDATMLTVDGKPAITWKAQTSRRLDQSALAAAHPDLFEQFKTSSTTRVFRIK